MSHVIRPLLSLVLLMLASGLFNTFVSVRLELEGFTNELIGVVTAALYLGVLMGSFWLDLCIVKWGHVRTFIGCALLTSLSILAQAIWIDPYYWAALRFVMGGASAGIFIIIESWLLMKASVQTRGMILSLYCAILYLSLSAGQLLIHIASPTTFAPFWITAALSLLSISPLIRAKSPEPKTEPTTRLSLLELHRKSPFGFFGGIVSGMLLAAVYGLTPVYAKESGMSIAEIGNLMALLIFGGLLFQWPMGRWADRGNRRKVLLTASFCASLSALGIALLGSYSPYFLFGLAFLFGGFSFTIYPLSMAHVCEKVPDHQIVPATGGFVLCYGVGAIAGPLCAPLAMDFLGSEGLFYFLTMITFILVLRGLKKRPQEEGARDSIDL